MSEQAPLVVRLTRSTRSQSQKSAAQPSGSSRSSTATKTAPRKETKPKQTRTQTKNGINKKTKTDLAGLKVLARQRAAEVKKEEEDESADEEVEDDDDGPAASGVHAVNIMCYRKSDDTNPYRQANTDGAQQTAYIHSGASFEEFLKMIAPSIANFLVNDSKDWDLAVCANGRGHPFVSLTRLGDSRDNIERTCTRWFAVVESGQERSLRAVGTRKPTIAQASNGKAKVASPQEDKENVAIPVIELSQSSDEGEVEYIGQSVRSLVREPLAESSSSNNTLPSAQSGYTLPATLSDQVLPVHGRDISVRRFARKFNLKDAIRRKLLDDGYEDASEVAEMESQNFEDAKISVREQVNVRSALKKWRLAALREDEDSGIDDNKDESPSKRQRTEGPPLASTSGSQAVAPADPNYTPS